MYLELQIKFPILFEKTRQPAKSTLQILSKVTVPCGGTLCHYWASGFASAWSSLIFPTRYLKCTSESILLTPAHPQV